MQETYLLVPLLIIIATQIILIILALRKKLPEYLQKLPERFSRLEALHEQLSSSTREGFKDARTESSAAAQRVENNLDQHLTTLRTDINHEKEAISNQRAAISDRIQEFIDNVSSKLDSMASSIRIEIQTQIGTLQKTLIESFSAQSSATGDAFAALQLLVSGKLNDVLSTTVSQHDALRSGLNNSFTAFKSEVANTLTQSESTQTSTNAALRDSIQKELSRISSQLQDSLEFQRRQLGDVADKTAGALEKVKESIDSNLKAISDSNENKLEQMRVTVDEKLHSTLERRLADSFSVVSDQLGKVQTGLGEMKDLASSVGDLKRVLTNVKSRGVFAEIQLGAQLENILGSNQYKTNVRVKPETTESVEFAICFPGNNGEECLLPIDAKFPREAWERLEAAREAANAEQISHAAGAFESSIRTEAKRISEKYINPPVTTDFAYMYLPTEALFAEVVRNPGLLEKLQTEYRIMVAGPTTLMALLISFQMGFRTLAIQKKGSEVWNTLAATKVQFGKFGELMNRVERNVGTIQNTLHDIGVRTRKINQTLSGVDSLQADAMNVRDLAEPLPSDTDQSLAQTAAAGQNTTT